MPTENTLVIIKPDAVEGGHIGEIITTYEQAGLTIVSARMLTLSRDGAAGFYAEHQGKPFFEALLDYMTSGAAVVMALSGEGAIAKVREINGATNPADAAEGTIRARYGVDHTRNSVHASAVPEDAAREVEFFFPGLD